MGLSQEELAKLVDVSKSAVSQWESEKGPGPTYAHVRELAVEFGVSVEWLETSRGVKRPAANMAIQEELVRDYEPPMTKDQRELLSIYKRLNIKRKKAVLELMRSF